jgi:hypothetical protein
MRQSAAGVGRFGGKSWVPRLPNTSCS